MIRQLLIAAVLCLLGVPAFAQNYSPSLGMFGSNPYQLSVQLPDGRWSAVGQINPTSGVLSPPAGQTLTNPVLTGTVSVSNLYLGGNIFLQQAAGYNELSRSDGAVEISIGPSSDPTIYLEQAVRLPNVATGTPATYACFDASKNLISSATAC